jgi:hypothetical protein
VATARNTVEGTLATTVTVGSGVANVPDIVFNAVILSGTASVVGSTDSTGIQVSLDGVGTPAATAADGSFSFTGVSAGFHSLTFTAPSGPTDTIPTLFFVPGSTPLVPDTATGAFFKMSPFELQVGRRAVSSTTLSSSSMVVSADGTVIAYVDSVDTGTGLGTVFTVTTSGGAPVQIATGANTSLKLSDDGRFVAYRKDGDLFVSQTTGGTPVKVSTNGVNSSAFDFSPASTTAPTIYFIGPDASGTSALFENSLTLTGTALTTSSLYSLPAVSSYTLKRRAKRIIFFESASGTITAGMRTAACKGATLLPADVVVFETSQISPQFFSADEARMGYNSFSVAPTGFKVMKTDGSALPVLVDAIFPSVASFSPDGTRVAYSDFSTLKTSDTTAPAPVVLGSNMPFSTTPVFSPSGTQVAYVVDDASVPPASPLRKKLYVGPPTVPAGAGLELAVGVSGPVAFSPDGTRVLYAANPTDGSPFNLFVRPLVGSALQVATAIVPSGFTPAYQFSRNGQRALFGSRPPSGNPVALSAVPVGGGTPITLSSSLATSAGTFTESPDGTRLLIRENQTFSPTFSWNVRVANLTSGATQALVSRATTALWGKAGTPLADKVVTLRTAAGAPYTFQNGIYVSDVP